MLIYFHFYIFLEIQFFIKFLSFNPIHICIQSVKYEISKLKSLVRFQEVRPFVTSVISLPVPRNR